MKTLREYIDQLDEISRRDFLKGAGAALGAAALGGAGDANATIDNWDYHKSLTPNQASIIVSLVQAYWAAKHWNQWVPFWKGKPFSDTKPENWSEEIKIISDTVKKCAQYPKLKEQMNHTYNQITDDSVTKGFPDALMLWGLGASIVNAKIIAQKIDDLFFAFDNLKEEQLEETSDQAKFDVENLVADKR
jgi:hypothetical protein